MVSTFTTFQLLENALLRICVLSDVLLPVQPNCAEPWTEVVFADDKEGKIQVQSALGCWHLTPYWSQPQAFRIVPWSSMQASKKLQVQ